MKILYFVHNRYVYISIQKSITERRLPGIIVLTCTVIVKVSSKVTKRDKGAFPFCFMCKYIYLLYQPQGRERWTLSSAFPFSSCYNTSQPNLPCSVYPNPAHFSKCSANPTSCKAFPDHFIWKQSFLLPNFHKTYFPYLSVSTYYLLTGRHEMFSEMF